MHRFSADRKCRTWLFADNREELDFWVQAIRRDVSEVYQLPPQEGAVTAEMIFYLGRPQKPKAAEVIVKPDLDKLVRAVLDALTGIVWKDDAQVDEIAATKSYVSSEHADRGLDLRLFFARGADMQTQGALAGMQGARSRHARPLLRRWRRGDENP